MAWPVWAGFEQSPCPEFWVAGQGNPAVQPLTKLSLDYQYQNFWEQDDLDAHQLSLSLPLWVWPVQLGAGAGVLRDSSEADFAIYGRVQSDWLGRYAIAYEFTDQQTFSKWSVAHALGLRANLVHGLGLASFARFGDQWQNSTALSWRGMSNWEIQTGMVFDEQTNHVRLAQNWQPWPSLGLESEVTTAPLRFALGLRASLGLGPLDRISGRALTRFHQDIPQSRAFGLSWLR